MEGFRPARRRSRSPGFASRIKYKDGHRPRVAEVPIVLACAALQLARVQKRSRMRADDMEMPDDRFGGGNVINALTES